MNPVFVGLVIIPLAALGLLYWLVSRWQARQNAYPLIRDDLLTFSDETATAEAIRYYAMANESHFKSAEHYDLFKSALAKLVLNRDRESLMEVFASIAAF